MAHRVLITGSMGLIGKALRAELERSGVEVAGFDCRGEGGERGDVRNPDSLAGAVRGCDGVIHLAAVSRVVWGERDPQTCWSVNVEGTLNVLRACHESTLRPWVIFGSSREVYGEPLHLPVSEDAPLAPVNIYGQSKVAGENLIAEFRATGVVTAIVRFSNVYGRADDHSDRVVPAFVRAAVEGTPLRVDGGGRTFDFTHLDDTVRGVVALSRLLDAGGSPDPIHLVTGTETSLAELARLAVSTAGTAALTRPGPEREWDVSHFRGNWKRARHLLGWEPRVSIEEGVRMLAREIRRQDTQVPVEVVAP